MKKETIPQTNGGEFRVKCEECVEKANSAAIIGFTPEPILGPMTETFKEGQRVMSPADLVNMLPLSEKITDEIGNELARLYCCCGYRRYYGCKQKILECICAIRGFRLPVSSFDTPAEDVRPRIVFGGRKIVAQLSPLYRNKE